ncbi:hypothetical protein ABZZ36_41700 [Actinacidiphila glaucinigra]|uniref:hypothetical protein n=1 Tax=Actinacidiphila glaucinigra TaxID=235986 RepID=UPI0033AF2C5B
MRNGAACAGSSGKCCLDGVGDVIGRCPDDLANLGDGGRCRGGDPVGNFDDVLVCAEEEVALGQIGSALRIDGIAIVIFMSVWTVFAAQRSQLRGIRDASVSYSQKLLKSAR